MTSIPLGAIFFYVIRATSLSAWQEEGEGLEMGHGPGMGKGQWAMGDVGTVDPEKRE